MRSGELFTRILYFAVRHLGMSIEEALLTPYALLSDFHDLFLEEHGMTKPITTIDSVIPDVV